MQPYCTYCFIYHGISTIIPLVILSNRRSVCFSFPAAFPAAQMAPVLPADASIPAFPAERTTNCGVGGRPRDSGNFTCSEGSAAQSVRAGRVACPASVAVRRHFVSFLPAALRRLTRFAAPPSAKNNTQFCQRTAV